MREFDVKLVTDAVAKLCIDANYNIPQDVLEKLKFSCENEESPVAKEILTQIIENDILANSENPEKTYIEEIMPKKLGLNFEYIEKIGCWYDINLIFNNIKKIIR